MKKFCLILLILCTYTLSACQNKQLGTTLEFSFNASETIREYHEVTLYIDEPRETVELSTSLIMDGGEVSIQVAAANDKTVIWENSYERDADFPIILNDLKADSEYILTIQAIDTKKATVAITSADKFFPQAQKYLQENQKPAKPTSEKDKYIKEDTKPYIADTEPYIEEPDSIEKIKKYMIPEQSFDIFLDDWGKVTFVSCQPSPDEHNHQRVASFYLINEERILYKFPYRFENNSIRGHLTGVFDSVGAVAFRDINNDKKDDVIVITCYITGAGPTGMIPRPIVTIYLAGENEFYLAEDMIAEIEEQMVENDRTIENICDFLQQKD